MPIETIDAKQKMKENDHTDDVLLQCVTHDNCFVKLSNMTTDEAIVIKKAMLWSIKEKYGDGFNTSAVIIFKDNATLAAENIIKEKSDPLFLIIVGVILFWCLALFIINYFCYKKFAKNK